MTLVVDGRELVPTGSLLDTILAAGVPLTHLCKDDNLPVVGACRTCLVEADGRIVAACSTPAAGVVRVETGSERVVCIRRGVLELTAGMHTPGPEEAGGPHRETSAEAIEREAADAARFPLRTARSVDDSNPFFSFHEEACILCARCVTACQALQHIGAIGMAGRGVGTRVTPGVADTFAESICTSCGSCVAACPTHALRPKGAR
jgi:predicted molibdopterin-dependent oxidoreductase YjgC